MFGFSVSKSREIQEESFKEGFQEKLITANLIGILPSVLMLIGSGAQNRSCRIIADHVNLWPVLCLKRLMFSENA